MDDTHNELCLKQSRKSGDRVGRLYKDGFCYLLLLLVQAAWGCEVRARHECSHLFSHSALVLSLGSLVVVGGGRLFGGLHAFAVASQFEL